MHYVIAVINDLHNLYWVGVMHQAPCSLVCYTTVVDPHLRGIMDVWLAVDEYTLMYSFPFVMWSPSVEYFDTWLPTLADQLVPYCQGFGLTGHLSPFCTRVQSGDTQPNVPSPSHPRRLQFFRRCCSFVLIFSTLNDGEANIGFVRSRKDLP